MGDEKINPVQMPRDMVIEATTDDGNISANNTPMEADGDEVQQESPSSSKTPIVNKPMKRRITPMAIGP